jgi:hypothetical protein
MVFAHDIYEMEFKVIDSNYYYLVVVSPLHLFYVYRHKEVVILITDGRSFESKYKSSLYSLVENKKITIEQLDHFLRRERYQGNISKP